MKKIIAAAVAAAIIAPMSAIAAGPTLYGKVHMSVNYLDNKADFNKYKKWSLNSNASRIGVKGSEDLGNGMKVGYLIEWSVGMDGSRNTADAGNAKDLNARNRAVTLSSGWGTLLAGQWDTPMKVLGRKIDMFGERLGDNRNLNKGAGLIDLRTPNTIAYITPNMAGFSVTAAYVFDATTNGTGDGHEGFNGNTADDTGYSAWSANALYNNGPFLIGVAYQNVKSKIFSDSVSDARHNQSVWRVAGSWDIAGSFKILGSYTGINNGFGDSSNDPNIATIGGSWKFGNNTLKGQYGWRSDENIGFEFDDRKAKSGANQWVIALDHAMSKRTTVYAEYGQMHNDRDAFAKVWGQTGNSARAGVGENNRGFGLGIIHNF
jgi:predicted porin